MILATNYIEDLVGGSSVTIPYTVSGYYRALVVAVQYVNDATLTYDGVPLTSIHRVNIGGAPSNFLDYFLLPNPALGTNDLVLTTTNNINDIHIWTATGVNQTTPSNAFTSGTDGGTGFTLSGLTTTVDDCFGFSFFHNGSASTWSDGSNVVFRGAQFGRRAADSNGSLGVAGAKSFVATSNSATTQYGLAIALAPAVLLPILSTNAISSIAQTSAIGNGSVDYDGDSTILERGFVWNTTTLPTTSNNKVVVAGTTGVFSGNLTGLAVNTLYYVRAYATNANGTSYGDEETFTTLNVASTDLIKDIGATDGETYLVSINVGGSSGSVTVKLGTTGTSATFNAGTGVNTFAGTYSGLSGLIITRSGGFNGTVDDVMYVQAPLDSTVNWALDTLTLVSAIESEVLFKRIEDDVFNNFAFYRYLDLLFKDLDGYVTVTIRQEREDNSTDKTKTFVVGNPSSGTVSPFQKKRISFLSKNQAIIIGLSNANIGETFSIAQFLLMGDKKSKRLFSSTKIIST